MFLCVLTCLFMSQKASVLFLGCNNDVPVINSGEYTNSTITDSQIIGTYEKNIKSIKNVKNFYLSTNSSSISENELWSENIPLIDDSQQFLWTYDEVNYTDDSLEKTQPRIIATYNEKKGNIKSIKTYNIYDSVNDGLFDFNNEKNLKIEQTVDKFEIFFSSNKSDKKDRKIEINYINFEY